jgi:ACS family hexuronate transporter-like MFS transporter
MDRQVLGVLKTTLQHDLGWNEIDYSNLVFVFQAAYAGGMVLMGRLVDRLGTRLGYALAMIFWSLASMAHAGCNSFGGFVIARSALGFGESGVFPASIKTVAEWFPRKERALATGIFNAGSNFGAILTPLIVPWITIHWGWRWAFLITGAIGFVWVGFWVLLYRRPEDHPLVSPAELAYIRSDPQPAAVSIKWASLLPYSQTWAFVLGKFAVDPIWWFLLFWIPDFLQRNHGLRLMQLGVPILVIYLLADVGSVAGGGLSSWLIHRGRSVNFSRKIAMLVCAICAIPVVFAPRIENLWGVGSVVGIGGMAGAIGGMLMAKIVGYVLQWSGSYVLPFLVAGSAYLLALAIIHALSPRLEPARIIGD